MASALDLSDELLVLVFRHLDIMEIFRNVRRCCRRFSHVAVDRHLIRALGVTEYRLEAMEYARQYEILAHDSDVVMVSSPSSTYPPPANAPPSTLATTNLIATLQAPMALRDLFQALASEASSPPPEYEYVDPVCASIVDMYGTCTNLLALLRELLIPLRGQGGLERIRRLRIARWVSRIWAYCWPRRALVIKAVFLEMLLGDAEVLQPLSILPLLRSKSSRQPSTWLDALEPAAPLSPLVSPLAPLLPALPTTSVSLPASSSDALTALRNPLLLCEPKDLAMQLCLRASALYSRMSEMGTRLFCRQRQRPRSVRDLIQDNNQLTYGTTVSLSRMWVAHCLVSFSLDTPAKRAEAITRFIHVVGHLMDMHNFHSAFAVWSGINHHAVGRLDKSWAAVKKETLKIRERQASIFSSAKSFKNLRDLHSAVPSGKPFVPYLGFSLTLITFIEDGLPTFLPGTLPRQINLQKLLRLHSTCLTALRSQRMPPYPFQLNIELQQQLAAIPGLAFSDDELYVLSRQLEPVPAAPA